MNISQSLGLDLEFIFRGFEFDPLLNSPISEELISTGYISSASLVSSGDYEFNSDPENICGFYETQHIDIEIIEINPFFQTSRKLDSKQESSSSKVSLTSAIILKLLKKNECSIF